MTTLEKAKVRPSEQLHIALIDLDFSWFPWQVDEVVEMWNAGATGKEIISKIGRDGDEVALLIMDLVRHRRIKKRPGGIYGA